MPAWVSRRRVGSTGFQANLSRMAERLAEVPTLEAKVVAESASKIDKFEQRGQLLPRERAARLLDRDSGFLALSALAGLGLHLHDDDGKKSALGGGSIVGIGTVRGKPVLVSASDSALKGGTVSPIGLRKAPRAQAIAAENKLPLIYRVESGGANRMHQSELFVEGGRAFAHQARLSAAGVPPIAVVRGASTAGGAYLPGLSDCVVLAKGRSSIYLAGPPLVKAAIGEDCSEHAWGASALHAEATGLGGYLAQNDAHAIALTRELLDKLHGDRVPAAPTAAPEALYWPDELPGVVPADDRAPYDVRDVIARLVDGPDFLELKASLATETVCGHARSDGPAVGIVGNNGAIQPTGSTQAAQCIQPCHQSSTPRVFLQNTTGYMVGGAAERGGAIQPGSKMIQAVANAQVPKFSVLLGGSFGACNCGLCGRGFDPRFIFSWPSARTAVMGGARAALVMRITSAAKLQKAGLPVNDAALATMIDQPRPRIDRKSHVLFGTARLWDDGVIAPQDTRPVLSLCLALALAAEAEAEARTLRPTALGVARF